MQATEKIYQTFRQSRGISIDSRTVKPGELFFALHGERTDGNQYIPMALEKGALAAVSDSAAWQGNPKVFVVEDTLTSLQQIAQFHRGQLDLPVLAITGSNGKTTTKELIARVLAKSFRVSATQGNLNNHIGVPLTLLQFTEKTDIGVVEMGANHKGEIAALCNIARPDYGIITNIGKAHLKGFGSYQGVIQAKSELYQYINAHEGVIYVNSDSSVLTGLLQDQELVAYGTTQDTHYIGRMLTADPFIKLEWTHNHPMGLITRQWGITARHISTRLPGSYNFENVMAAIAIGADLNIPEQAIKEAIETYQPQNQRSEWKQTRHNNIFMDAYNANPTSMKYALEHFAGLERKNKIVMIGDMLELGEYAAAEHEAVIDWLEGQNVFAETYLVGPLFGLANKNFKHFPDTQSLMQHLQGHTITNATILLKASRGIGLDKLVDAL